MEENKKQVIDILELGKREKVVTLVDPDNADITSNIRLVRMNKSQAEKCFKASRKTYQETKDKLLEEETKTGLFSTLVKKMDKKTILEVLLTPDRISLEQNIDLVEIPDEKEVTKELKDKGLSDEEIDEELDKIAQGRIEEKLNEKRAELEKETDEVLQTKIKDQLIEMETNRVANEKFTELALCYMCYYEDGKKLIFSDDPGNELYVTNILRSTVVYYQLVAAYRDFLTTLNMTPKEIRGQAKRGGDFFTSRK